MVVVNVCIRVARYIQRSSQLILADGVAVYLGRVLAVGGGVAFRAYLISRMSNVRQAAAADAYVDAGSFHLTDSSDTFVFMTVQHIAKARPADDDLPDFDSDADCSDDDHGGGGGSF